MSGNSSVGRASASQANPLSFNTLGTAYLDHRVAEGKVRNSYIHLWNTWQPVLGARLITDVQPADILHWLNHYQAERKWTPQTRLHAINTLSGFYNWAIRQGFCQENPCAKVPKPKVRNERRFVISREQLTKLLNLLPAWCRDLVIVAAHTGLRFSNLVNLKPSDLRQDEDGDMFLEVMAKNGDLHRVFLYGQALEICTSRASRGSKWLLSGRNGGKVTQKTLNRSLAPAAKAVGLEWGRTRYGFTFHSLRRAFASHLLNNGASIEEVMAAGGWKSYDAVKRYAYLSNKRKKDTFKSLKLTE